MMKIETIDGGVLRPAEWRMTYLLKPDRKLLVDSLLMYGWTSPILANAKTKTIIDGHERWRIAADEDEIRRRDDGKVPVLWVEADEMESMLMHIRLNRGRGQVMAKPLSDAMRKIVRSKAYSQDGLKRALHMTSDESSILFDGGLIKQRNIADHVYSRAWVPIEASKGAVAPSMSIERPPNADR